MNFSKEVTNYCKGIAVVMLLMHHLWSCPNSEVYPVWLTWCSQQCKVCVAIFVFLSGFGLARAGCDWRRMFLARIPKLLLNYWFVAFVFLTIGFLFFGMTFAKAYSNGRYWVFALQMFGVNFVAPYGGFNPTWWYMNAAIPLYLAAPLAFYCIRKVPLCGLIVVCCLSIKESGRFVFWVYMSTFYAGMMAANYNWFERALAILGGKRLFLGSLVLAALFVAVRRFCGLILDGYLAFLVVIMLFVLYENVKRGRGPIVVLGSHSMNIFLLHTFFRGCWFPSFFNNSSPWLTFPCLLLLSLLCSVFIESAKRHSSFDKMLTGFGLRRNRFNGC